MIRVKEETTMVGLSEFRTKIDEILKASKTQKVLILKRNEPVAILTDINRFNKMEETLDLLEDYVLGLLAKEREKGSKKTDYIDIRTALKRLKGD